MGAPQNQPNKQTQRYKSKNLTETGSHYPTHQYPAYVANPGQLKFDFTSTYKWGWLKLSTHFHKIMPMTSLKRFC
jgi:hypothetical protein